MRRQLLFLLLVTGLSLSCSTESKAAPNSSQPTDGWKELTPAQANIIEACGTERPFSGKYLKHKEKGTYTCARCGNPLFQSKTKFDSGSGWPSFDDAIGGALKEVLDKDGRRKEIRCARCDGHLGHVFRGEHRTPKNTRHCVNSLALDFASRPMAEAYFAGGCFWGVEHLLENQPGVIRVESGYMGGKTEKPHYKQVVTGRTGHAETVRVLFDPTQTDYQILAKRFFEIHDPSQVNRQGPDVGTQYRSAVFVADPTQEGIIHDLIKQLRKKGFTVNTVVEPAGVFWPAEKYHQNYYKKTGKAPYCHAHTPRF